MPTAAEFRVAAWPAPKTVTAGVTTRRGGVSQKPYDGLNLGTHVGDQPAAVALNRRLLAAALPDVREIVWLNQVHGAEVAIVDGDLDAGPPTADAAVTTTAGRAIAILTADCLPVVLTDQAGRQVGAAHAGWRGLTAGVLTAIVAAMTAPPGELIAWLGPFISAEAYEVGDDVRSAMVAGNAAWSDAFTPNDRGRWQADLGLIARQQLTALGVGVFTTESPCTHSDAEAFFSYRRDGTCGRIATLIYRI